MKYAYIIYIKTLIFLFDKFRNMEKINLRINTMCTEITKFLYAIGFKFEYVEQDKSQKNISKILILCKNDFK